MNTSARGRTHRAIQLGNICGSGASPSRVCRIRHELNTSSCSCFVSGSSHGHQCTHSETVKKIQQSKACFNVSTDCQPCIHAAVESREYFKIILFKITTNLFKFMFHIEHKCLRWSHAVRCLWNGNAYKVQPSVLCPHWMSGFLSMQYMFYYTLHSLVYGKYRL